VTPEEREIYERDKRRCQAEADRLRALSGDPAARKALDEAWAPLLRRAPAPDPPCLMPYYAPELLP
jgi:hypothetical protein